MRGEFIRANGLVIPNNITTIGVQAMLGLAIRGEDCEFVVGLCSAVYAPDMLIGDVTEPEIGTHGYDRIALNRDLTDWPVVDQLNGERYIESKELVWEATGGAFSEEITRMFILLTSDTLTEGIFALSAALPQGITIDEDTDAGDRTFKYRIYLR